MKYSQGSFQKLIGSWTSQLWWIQIKRGTSLRFASISNSSLQNKLWKQMQIQTICTTSKPNKEGTLRAPGLSIIGQKQRPSGATTKTTPIRRTTYLWKLWLKLINHKSNWLHILLTEQWSWTKPPPRTYSRISWCRETLPRKRSITKWLINLFLRRN